MLKTQNTLYDLVKSAATSALLLNFTHAVTIGKILDTQVADGALLVNE